MTVYLVWRDDWLAGASLTWNGALELYQKTKEWVVTYHGPYYPVKWKTFEQAGYLAYAGKFGCVGSYGERIQIEKIKLDKARN